MKTPLKDGAADGVVATDGKADTASFKDQGGMFEAPPPPMDAPIAADARPDLSDAGDSQASEAGAIDTGTSDAKLDSLVFKDQGGMVEAPPPPMDAKRDSLVFKDQGGANEMAPPPADAAVSKRD